MFSVTPETATGRHNDVNNRGCSVPEVTDSYCSPKPKSEVDDTKQGLSVQTPTLLEDQTSYWTRWMKDFKKNYKVIGGSHAYFSQPHPLLLASNIVKASNAEWWSQFRQNPDCNMMFMCTSTCKMKRKQ